jgi:hypothetical protein
MAKRFTDTEKWKKAWFRSLSPAHKCFWGYILDNCTAAGIWEVDFGLAAYMIGHPIKEDEIREIFKKQYLEIADGKRWYIQDFIDFQYGTLQERCKPHTKVIAELTRLGLYPKGIDTLKEDVQRVSNTLQDKDKEEDIVKEEEKEKGGHGGKKTGPYGFTEDQEREIIAEIATARKWAVFSDATKVVFTELMERMQKNPNIENRFKYAIASARNEGKPIPPKVSIAGPGTYPLNVSRENEEV